MSGPPMVVGVLFGGPSPEHDVSVLTGLQAAHELARSAQLKELRLIYWAKSGSFYEVAAGLEGGEFAGGVPDGATPLELVVADPGGFVSRRGRLGRLDRLELDAVLVCCHGGPGEDGSLQAALDLATIAYSGPSCGGAALGMDKLASAGVVTSAGIAALSRVALYEGALEPPFPGPYIVKPRFGGSSIGIDVVADFPTALARLSANVHLRRGAVLEPYRPDLFDLQVAVRTWPELELSAIERPVRRHEGAEILDYADKYVGGEGMDAAPRELPALIPESLAGQVLDAARSAAVLLDVRGVARVDFLSDGTELFLNEINTIPGSLSRYLFIDPVVSFAQLLGDLLSEAVARPTAQYTSAGADGTVLRSAGSISSKLG